MYAHNDLQYTQNLISNSVKRLNSPLKSDNLIGYAKLDEVAKLLNDNKTYIDFVNICLEENNLTDYLPHIKALLK